MYYIGDENVVVDQSEDTGIDLIHGGILTMSLSAGEYLYHGDFDGAIWVTPTTARQAKLYKRPLNDLSNASTYIQFTNDYHHQNIVDIIYSEKRQKIYVLFMGNSCIAEVNPTTLAWSDFITFEDLDDDRNMGKLAVSDTNLYHICQLNPQSKVIRYDLTTGVKQNERDLAIPAAHGGLFFNGYLYVTTSQNDGTGFMVYKLHPTTLRIQWCKRITTCAVATHEMAGMFNPYTGVPYLFIGYEGQDQDPTTIANVVRVNANKPNEWIEYSTNTVVQGGIWGVKAQEGMIWVSRGSTPGSIEMLDPWNATSTFFEITAGLGGVNGTPDIHGNTIYLKTFPRLVLGSGTSSLLQITIN